MLTCSGESGGNNSNEGLSDPSVSHSLSYSHPTPSVTVSVSNKSVHLRMLDDPDFDTEVALPSLDAIIPNNLLRKLKPKEKKRLEVINGDWC